MTGAEAVRVGRTLLGRSVEALVPQAQSLLAPPPASKRKAGMPLAVSTMAHAAMLVMAVVVTTSGLTQEERKPQDMPPAQPLRMVYLAKPGPGGGGGGGGRLEKKAPPKIQRKAPVERKVSAPAPPVRPAPPAVVPVAKPPEPPPPVKASPLPAVVAPVASVPADSHDRVGVVAQSPAVEASHGPGSGGGVGSGKGTGVGEGDGPGLGPGSGGGTGGGPYRPGSGIEAPRLLREFKPDYTEEARQRGIEGDVVMEIVVRRDGSVGEVKVLQGLGYGLDRRATDAVRQWKFAPAKRLGSPVDVMVEVAMEFKLR
jgi:TonB family protein